MNADDDIQQLKKDLVYTVRLTTCDANKYLEQFWRYDYIWLDDKHLRLKTFLQECERKMMEEDDDYDDYEADDDGAGHDGNGNARADNDIVYDPNVQTEMFQNQVRVGMLRMDSGVSFLLFFVSRSRTNWMTATTTFIIECSLEYLAFDSILLAYELKRKWKWLVGCVVRGEENDMCRLSAVKMCDD